MQRLIHILNRTILTRKISLRPTIQLYSTSLSSSSSSVTDDDSFANYLVSSLGFSNQQAQSASNRVSKNRSVYGFNFYSNAVSVVGFFKSYGFNDTHLTRIVALCPTLLCSNAEDTLRPKLQLLQDHGFSKSDIIEVVYGNPRLLESGLESSLVPAFQVLRQVMGSDTLVIAILKKSRFKTSETKNLMGNVALVVSYGIPIELIRKHILLLPAAFMRNSEMFNVMVSRVINKWGICPNSLVFLYGVQLLCRLSEEAIESKCHMFKSFGWTQSEIQTLMMKNPNCFSSSEATIKKKLNFLMNELRLEPAYLITHSAFFTYSLEKRIVPRHKILVLLKEKGLREKNSSLSTAISIPEACFLKRLVLPFKEVHQVYAELTGCSMKMLTQETSETRS